MQIGIEVSGRLAMKMASREIGRRLELPVGEVHALVKFSILECNWSVESVSCKVGASGKQEADTDQFSLNLVGPTRLISGLPVSIGVA